MPTLFVTNTQAARSKVQCLPHSQFLLMFICLADVSASACYLEAAKGLAVVGDVAADLQ